MKEGLLCMMAEVSDSNSSSCSFNESISLRNSVDVSSGKLKRVVPQQNGHWGAQICAKKQRIWLGTLKSEMQAGMAYDSAAIKLWSGDAHRNYPWTGITTQESAFQRLYSTEAVLNMI